MLKSALYVYSNLFNFFLFWGHGIRDLSSWTRDWTCTACSGSFESQTPGCQAVPGQCSFKCVNLAECQCSRERGLFSFPKCWSWETGDWTHTRRKATAWCPICLLIIEQSEHPELQCLFGDLESQDGGWLRKGWAVFQDHNPREDAVYPWRSDHGPDSSPGWGILLWWVVSLCWATHI